MSLSSAVDDLLQEVCLRKKYLGVWSLSSPESNFSNPVPKLKSHRISKREVLQAFPQRL
jgi:hypothetical protein